MEGPPLATSMDGPAQIPIQSPTLNRLNQWRRQMLLLTWPTMDYSVNVAFSQSNRNVNKQTNKQTN